MRLPNSLYDRQFPLHYILMWSCSQSDCQVVIDLLFVKRLWTLFQMTFEYFFLRDFVIVSFYPFNLSLSICFRHCFLRLVRTYFRIDLDYLSDSVWVFHGSWFLVFYWQPVLVCLDVGGSSKSCQLALTFLSGGLCTVVYWLLFCQIALDCLFDWSYLFCCVAVLRSVQIPIK